MVNPVNFGSEPIFFADATAQGGGFFISSDTISSASSQSSVNLSGVPLLPSPSILKFAGIMHSTSNKSKAELYASQQYNSQMLNSAFQAQAAEAAEIASKFAEIQSLIAQEFVITNNQNDYIDDINTQINYYNNIIQHNDFNQIVTLGQAVRNYNNATNSYNSATTTYTAAQATYSDATQAYTDATATFTAAQALYQQQTDDYHNGLITQAVYNADTNTFNAAQSAYTDATNTYNDATSAFNDATTAYNTAQNNYTAARTTYSNALSAYNNYANNVGGIRDPTGKIPALNHAISDYNNQTSTVNADISAINNNILVQFGIVPPLHAESKIFESAETSLSNGPSLPPPGTTIQYTEIFPLHLLNPTADNPRMTTAQEATLISTADANYIGLINAIQQLMTIYAGVFGIILDGGANSNNDPLEPITGLPPAYYRQLPKLFFSSINSGISTGTGAPMAGVVKQLDDPNLSGSSAQAIYESTERLYQRPLSSLEKLVHGYNISLISDTGLLSGASTIGLLGGNPPIGDVNSPLVQITGAQTYASHINNLINSGAVKNGIVSLLTSAYPNASSDQINTLAGPLSAASSLYLLHSALTQTAVALSLPGLPGNVISTVPSAQAALATAPSTEALIGIALSNPISIAFLKNQLSNQLAASGGFTASQAQEIINTVINNALARGAITSLQQLNDNIQQAIQEQIDILTANGQTAQANTLRVQSKLLADTGASFIDAETKATDSRGNNILDTSIKTQDIQQANLAASVSLHLKEPSSTGSESPPSQQPTTASTQTADSSKDSDESSNSQVSAQAAADADASARETQKKIQDAKNAAELAAAEAERKFLAEAVKDLLKAEQKLAQSKITQRQLRDHIANSLVTTGVQPPHAISAATAAVIENAPPTISPAPTSEAVKNQIVNRTTSLLTPALGVHEASKGGHLLADVILGPSASPLGAASAASNPAAPTTEATPDQTLKTIAQGQTVSSSNNSIADNYERQLTALKNAAKNVTNQTAYTNKVVDEIRENQKVTTYGYAQTQFIQEPRNNLVESLFTMLSQSGHRIPSNWQMGIDIHE